MRLIPQHDFTSAFSLHVINVQKNT